MIKINLIKILLIGSPLVCGTIMTTACDKQNTNKQTKFDPWNLSTWGSKKTQIIKDAGANPNIADMQIAMENLNSDVSLESAYRNINYVRLGKNLYSFVGIKGGFKGDITIQFNS